MSRATATATSAVDLDESYTETSEVVTPDSTNNLGRALGGWVLQRMDSCGAIAARRFASSQVVTASVERVDFHAPIDLGDVAVVTGYVFETGRTSMRVRVDVSSERPRDARAEQGESRDGERGAKRPVSEDVDRKTASSDLTFVAVDEDGEPRDVPMLRCSSTREHDLRTRALDGED